MVKSNNQLAVTNIRYRIMKIVIAMDSFKGTITAGQACEIIADAIAESTPDAKVVIKPMADGGEGTARALLEAANGRWIQRTVMGPLPDMQVNAGFAWFEEDRTALVEMASASGLELLSQDQMNPLKTTTYGTGQLIKAASEYGGRKILLAVGGSATVDGGCGAAAALGWEFIDKTGKQILPGGAGLTQIAKIVEPKDLNLPSVEVLCDVDNPLCGDRGAARVYGPQKGASAKMVEQLEKGLTHLAELIRKSLQRDISHVAGAGAAGGLAAGALAFMDATLVSGIETVIERSGLAAELESADWVITGEGCFDRQSLYGKVVSGIAKMARRFESRLAVIAGEVTISPEDYQKIGISTAISCRANNMSIDYALKNCRGLLRSAAQQFAKKQLIR